MCVTLFYYESNNKMLHPLPTQWPALAERGGGVQGEAQVGSKKSNRKFSADIFIFLNHADREINKMNGYRQPKSRFKTCLWWVGLLPTGFVFGLVGTPRNGQLAFV